MLLALLILGLLIACLLTAGGGLLLLASDRARHPWLNIALSYLLLGGGVGLGSFLLTLLQGL